MASGMANNGAALVLRFEKVRTQSMREAIATGVINELEFGLLKGSSKKTNGSNVLGWGVEEKGVLLNMEVDDLTATQGNMKLEVEVRSLCFSRGVTADYLKPEERFNMKQCVLVLGDLGKGVAPWSELVQTAVYLHRNELNIIWIDVPSFASNPQMWLKFGAETIRGLLKYLCIKQASVVARGIGGAVFLEALAKAPELFGRTHFVYNADIPPGKGYNLPIFEIEEVLRTREIQLWFAFKDDEAYDRGADGSPMKAYDAIQKIQARLLGERQRSKRELHYDEVLITENLNVNPIMMHVRHLELSIYKILVFSNDLLESIGLFLQLAPGTRQEHMENGLVGDFRAASHSMALNGGDGGGEPLCIRRHRIGYLHGLENRPGKARNNKRMLKNVTKAVSKMALMLPDVQNGQAAGFPDELARRLEDQGIRSDASGSRNGSRGGSLGGSRGGSLGGSRAVSNSLAGSRLGTKDGGSLGGSRAVSNSLAGSRVSTKDVGRPSLVNPALPALLSHSASSPGDLQALANHPANPDSDEEEEEEEEEAGSLLDVLGPTPGVKPWQNYRRMWQDMHGRAPSGYTHPMKAL